MKIAVIGIGVMGSALARQLSRNNQIILYSRNPETAKKLAEEIKARHAKSLKEALDEAEVIFLCFKPKDLASFTEQFEEGKIVISILAGTSIAMLKRAFPRAHILRVMPNLALICGQGVIGIAEEAHFPSTDKARIDALFQEMGLVLWLTENKLEALTALAASGLGFVYAMMEAMIDGGVHLGFSAAESEAIIAKTFEGATALMHSTGKSPAELRTQISSPGGTTIEGLREMERRSVKSGIVEAMIACYKKANQMKES